MKKLFAAKLFSLLVFVVVSVIAFSSCTTKKYYYDEYYGLTVGVGYYDVDKNDFRWDNTLGRWYCTKNDTDLTENQLRNYEMAGTVIFGDDFCPMPYVDSYYVDFSDGTWVQVVQNTGFEVTYGKVTFYIQTNEKDITWDNMLDKYKFKVSLFY